MNSKKLTVLTGALAVLIAVVATLSVADDPRESVSTAVSEPARSLEAEAPEMLQESPLASTSAGPVWCCCPTGCAKLPFPCPPSCDQTISPGCVFCPILADEDQEQVEVTWSVAGDETDL